MTLLPHHWTFGLGVISGLVAIWLERWIVANTVIGQWLRRWRAA